MVNFVCFTVALVVFGFMAAWQRALLAVGLFAFVFPFWLNAIRAIS
jgi:hypothetical protein